MKLFAKIFISILCSCPTILFAQLTESKQAKVDSLSEIITSPNYHDSSKAKAYVDLSDILYIVNFDTVITLCEQSIRLINAKLKEDITPEEKKNYLKVLAGAYNNIGFIYDDKGDVVKAIEFYHKSLKIREDLDDKPGLGETLNNLGIIYIKQGNPKQALEYYLQSLKIKESLGNKKSIATTLNNIGAVYRELNKLTQALKFYKRSLSLRKEIGNKRGIATSLSNIGTIYKTKNSIDTALIYYYQSLKIREEIKDKPGLVKVLINISSAELNNGNIINAKKFGLKSQEIAKELGFSDGIKYSAKILSEIYSKEEKWKQAYKMQELYVIMKDSMRNNATELATLQLKSKYDLEKAEKEYKLLEQENDIQELKYNKNRIVIVFLILAFVMALITAIIAYRGYRKKGVINELLKYQKEDAIKQNNEKIVLLKEIHHRVKNSLQVVSSLLRLQSHEVEDEKINKMFEETQNRVLSIAKLHEQLYNSENLKEIDIKDHFFPLISELVDEYNVGTKIELDLKIATIMMGADTLVPLGLIINEMISNSLKYAFPNKDAGKIIVHIKSITDEKFEMIIGDNGIGMPLNFSFGESTSLGTQLIQIFTEQLNGSIQRIESEGTLFKVIFMKQKS